MANFKDYNSAVRSARVTENLAAKVVKRIYPLPRFATVIAINATTRTVTVKYPEETGTFTIPVLTMMPITIGSIVRVNGHTGKRYVDAVLNGNAGFQRLMVENAGNGYTTLTEAVTNAASGLWLVSGGMNTDVKHTPPVVFGSTDPNLLTRNPKPLASIHGEASQAYSSDVTGGMHIVFSTTAGSAGTNSTPVEAMRITGAPSVWIGDGVDNGGQDHRLLLGPATSLKRNISSKADNTAQRNHITFINPNGNVGLISTTASATTYATTSDQRLKTDLGPASGDRIRDLLIRNFRWKSDQTRGVGVFAQEAHKIIPEAVQEGGMDPTIFPWSVDYSKFVPDLIAYSQGLERRIDDLESRLARMEAQLAPETPQ